MDMSPWLVITGMMLVTYPVRLSVVTLMGSSDLPPGIHRALRFVPPAALAAIIFPELLMPGGTFSLAVTNFRLVAGVVAALVAWRSRRTLLPIGVGMALLWLLQSLPAASG